MEKHQAVAALGEEALARPSQLRAALRANDRLKLYLTILQAAREHADAPHRPPLDLGAEIGAAGLAESSDAAWLRDLPAMATRDRQLLLVPGLARLKQWMCTELEALTRPVRDEVDIDPRLVERANAWQHRLQELPIHGLGDDLLADLVRGDRAGGDSLHLLVMDLHKVLHRLEGRVQGIDVAGAHAWNLSSDGSDAPMVEAFMRGVSRTRGAKLAHPGLDTSATRDGDRLLIQNDIGTNDAHLLVVQVERSGWKLTYSDLHRRRFDFFRRTVESLGATWSGTGERTNAALNEGRPYFVGIATFSATEPAALLQSLEALGSRLVFLIDWNRARKRLTPVVGKEAAEKVLEECARREVGHVAWLSMGAERLLWSAMAAQRDAFRLGDRLDQVLGEEAAREWLVEVFDLSRRSADEGRPTSFVSDEARLSLARRLQGRHGEMELLLEHASWCHELAQGLRDGLAHGVERDEHAARRLAERAKQWERRADEIVERARSRAERQPRWKPQALLLQLADDIADQLEEAIFVLSVIAEGHHHGWGNSVREAMQALSQAVLGAVKDHVKALAMEAPEGASNTDRDQAIDALWRVVQAERQCDELLRAARRALAREVKDATSLQLGNELAAAMEVASDCLLAVGHQLRRATLNSEGVSA